jgi:aldehyde dehydrogenase (NAD+)
MNDLFQKQKRFFETNATKNVLFRMEILKLLKDAITSHEREIQSGLHKDLGLSESEASLHEIRPVLREIADHLQNLKKWMEPRKGPGGYQTYEPLGVNLIISPWTSPFSLALLPLVGAISAGNTAMVKPSENAPATSAAVMNLIKDTFTEEFISIITGDRQLTSSLLDLDFDHIFFTGNQSVGKLVMSKAAYHLSKVTLELGGKNPCIIDQTANIRLTTMRIAYAKGLMAGQTCTAPDYIICHERIFDALVHYLTIAFQKLYGADPLSNSDYPKIINEFHINRLLKFLSNEEIVYGGKINREALKIEPTIVKVSKMACHVMQEEILGPILPIITYENISEIGKILAKNPHPLVLHIFSGNKALISELSSESYGTMIINNTWANIRHRRLPFGGVRQSGNGLCLGYESFKTFSHPKSIYHFKNIEMEPFFPPYTIKTKRKIRKFLLKNK